MGFEGKRFRPEMNELNDAGRDEMVARVVRFVRIPSRSSPEGGEEGALQTVVAEEMRGLGARVRTFEPDDVPAFRTHPLCHGPERRYEGRPTVIGELGPPGAPALLLMAHSDTVPVNDPEAWTCDPFAAEIREGAVWGLGASDDKWGLATLLVIMGALSAEGKALRKRLIFASTIDEEHGVGNGALLLTLAGVKAEGALYLDGCDMDICIGNMGGSSLSMRPKGVLAPETMSRHGAALDAACKGLSKRRSPLYARPYLEKNVTREGSVLFRREEDAAGPFFKISFYTVPEEDRASFCPELEKAVSGALGREMDSYELRYYEPWFEFALAAENNPMVRHVAAAGRALLDRDLTVNTISKQDAFVLINHARIPTVSFGVSRHKGPGAVHRPDERVWIDEAWQGCRVACDAVRRWLCEDPV